MKRIFTKGLISRFWWIPLVTGLICLGLGIWCLCDPTDSLPILAYVFASGLCLAGVLNFVVAFANTGYYGWGWSLCLGILELICGIWLFCLPGPEITLTFMYIIGFWILIVAINGICESVMLMAYNPFWVIWMILLLFCTIAFSIIFIVNPIGTVYVSWIWLGISLIAYGLYRISFAANMQRLGKRTDGLI